MDAIEFRRVLTAFADSPAAIEMDRGRLLVQVREDLIEATIAQKPSGLEVTETGSLPVRADRWIIDRVARVPQLADRLLTYIAETDNFVAPRGDVREDLERAQVSANPSIPDDGLESVISILGRRPGGTSTVLYLTSDAGEGKTTLINELARRQARLYKAKAQDWLLIPISLGGRPFMRFDDVVIGALVNRFRFPFFYYDAFLELVRLGVIVPAFDGFEEMFIESASGEALSALGNLVNVLDSSGTILVSARKAYFEFKDFRSQAKLFDAIKSKSVTFAQVALRRWSREQFLEYAHRRGVVDGEGIYRTVEDRLGPDHPILTRAVLVNRLLDVATSVSSSEVLAQKLEGAAQDYFYDFVNAIIEREANEKWIDRSGSPARPLLSVEEHHELLAILASEMWISGVEALRTDVVDLLAEMFAESHGKTPEMSRQIKERLKQHALITTDLTALISFDHDDFRRFFLGQAVAAALRDATDADVRALLQRAVLSGDVLDNAAQILKRSIDRPPAVPVLLRVAATDHSTSFTRENAAALVVRLLDGETEPHELKDLSFPVDSLSHRALTNLKFTRCFFSGTSLEGTRLERCGFSECIFTGIDVEPSRTLLKDVTMSQCEIRTVHLVENDVRLFEPSAIVAALSRVGFTLPLHAVDVPSNTPAEVFDDRVVLVERAMRVFLRKTQPNEAIFRLKLGVKGSEFFDHVLPELIRVGVVAEIAYQGGGKQRRFRLATPMQNIERGIRDAGGSFEKFIALASKS